jgi:hypothetical protein
MYEIGFIAGVKDFLSHLIDQFSFELLILIYLFNLYIPNNFCSLMAPQRSKILFDY